LPAGFDQSLQLSRESKDRRSGAAIVRLVALAATILFGAFGICLAAGPADAPVGAASCSGCHPSKKVDTPVLPLAGRDAGAIIAAMQAFKAGEMSATVMNRIAKGFTTEEVKAIAEWYAAEKD